ncbi:hypothetical protein JMUB6875_51430 [Nocardia sp. JMUB6875]|uniref:hypothetical protein n=1 Tax=Nocardia sp. JMUB6875 TaxID=3158170 RepID=UPI0032E5A467
MNRRLGTIAWVLGSAIVALGGGIATADCTTLSPKEINTYMCTTKHHDDLFYAEWQQYETRSVMTWNGAKNPFAAARQDLFGTLELTDSTRDQICGPQQKKFQELTAKYRKEYDNQATLRPEYKDEVKRRHFPQETASTFSQAICAEKARSSMSPN